MAKQISMIHPFTASSWAARNSTWAAAGARSAPNTRAASCIGWEAISSSSATTQPSPAWSEGWAATA
eukprot:3344540-Alexandrium_andersonii.AAC.1